MFSSRMFGGNPSSFKLVLEYGKDSFREHPAVLTGAQVRLTKALAALEFEFNSDESEAAVLERFTQAKSRIAFDRLEERVVLKLSYQEQSFVAVKLSTACMSPTLRSLQVVRTSSTGTAPEALLTALFKHCDLSGVWKLRGAEGFGNFWCSCCEVRSWRSLANMNLSHCGLTLLPPALSALVTLRILRLSHNKLSSLPAEVSALTALEVLAADHNQLTAIPAELRRCSSLRYLELEDNRLVTPVLDLRALSNLVSLELYGNPLEYLPELSPATALRKLSLANVRVMADAAYSRWEVEVAPVPYISRGHKLSPLFKLTFRRSSCQHPLLAGALGRISEDRAQCELMSREETAIQQLVLMALSEQPVVAEQACRTLGALAQLGLSTARRLLAHDVVSTIVTLLRSPRPASKLCGLTLLGSLAAASEAVSAELLTMELLQLLHACIQADVPDPRVAALTALANLAFCRDNKLKIRAAAGLLTTLMELAAPPPAAESAVPAVLCSPTAASAAAAQQLLLEGPLQLPTDPLSPVGQVPEPGTATPAAVRMPLRAGTNCNHRHSDTGGAAAASASGKLSSWIGSPPGASMSYGGKAQGPAAAAASGGSGTSPLRSSQWAVAAAASPGADVLSPPQQQQQVRSMHHSVSTPAVISGAAAVAAPRFLSPVQTSVGSSVPAAAAAAAVSASGGGCGPLSPTSTSAGADGSAAATASSLPPQIALAPPRPVPEPVARRDQARLLSIKVLAILGENEHVRRALGHPPIQGRGVRVLALDGGGMRGLALVQIMRHIERRAGRPLHQLFDLVVGTSTGAIVAFGLGVFHFSLDQCESIYTGLGHKVFNQAGVSPREELLAAAQAQVAASAAASAAGASAAPSSAAAASTGWRDSLFRVVRGTSTNLRVAVYGFKHDASTFEELLKQMCDVKKLGCVGNQLIDAAALGGPKVAAVATLVSCCPVTPFLFTSYELPPEVAPAAASMRACPSSCRHQLWQAVRASSAAPYYLDDFVCGDERYQDGAATANNPSILALQQARLLWPDVRLEALVSLGCGAAPSVRRERGAHAVLDTGAVLVDAATSPDRADEALSTLLPLVPGVRYFRFQPIHERCSMELDDVNPQHWAALQAAVDEYCTAHAARIDELAELLLSGREDGGGGGGGDVVEGQESGDAAEAEAEAEELFEVPPGVGPDGGPLPPVPRVRLGARRGVVIVEAPRAPANCPPGGGAGDGSPLLVPPEQRVVEALAHRPHTLRRCDLAATAADAALSAALAEAHMRLLGAHEQQQQQQQAATVPAEEDRGPPPPPPPLPPPAPQQLTQQNPQSQQQQWQQHHGVRARSLGSVCTLAAPVAAAEEAAAAAEERGARRRSGLEEMQRPAPSLGGAAISALLSPTRTPPAGQPPRLSTGNVRHLLPCAAVGSREGPSRGGWLQAVAGGGQGVMEVAGDVVAAEAAAAAAATAAEAAGVMPAATVPDPPPPPEATAASSSVADAAVEAAEAAGVAGPASGGDGAAGGRGNPGSTATASAATATSLLYDFLFYKRSSTRAMSTGGGSPAPAAPVAPAPPPASAAAASTGRTAGMAAGKPAPGAAPTPVPVAPAGELSVRADGAAFSLPLRSPTSMVPRDPASVLPCPPAKPPATASECTRGASPGADNPHAGSVTGGKAVTVTAAAAAAADGGRLVLVRARSCGGAGAGGNGNTSGGGGGGGVTGPAVTSAGPREVRPAVLLAALLQDLQDRCGLLHLGLRPVWPGSGGLGGGGSGGGGGAAGSRGRKEHVAEAECGLVASWREEVVAVVEPGPDADRILSELGYPAGASGATAGGGGGRPSLASLFSAAHGAVLESSRCRTYRLLARQEVWHQGGPLATLLLQVSRPAALLRPGDFAIMAPQLSGLVVTAAAPLPPPVITALLRAGAAAVLCPSMALLPASEPAAAVEAVQRLSAGGSAAEGQRQRSPPPQLHPLQAVSSVAAAGCGGRSGGGAEGAGVGADAVAAYLDMVVGELVAGATVLGAVTAADRQHTALRGFLAFHHL